MNSGSLYIVATPIGNLGDITLRALEILKEVDFAACEDTRVTAKLLNHYNIKKPLISYHQHSKITRVEKIIEHLEAGKNIALVTDAGTPGISDPGNHLVSEVLKNNIAVVPIPGPSALGAIISVAGIDLQKFVFLGFPPHKKGRETFFKNIFNFEYPVIIYESKHRLKKALADIACIADTADLGGLGGGSSKKINIVVGRELTKIHEEIIRGDINSVRDYFETNEDKVRGEFAVIIYKEK